MGVINEVDIDNISQPLSRLSERELHCLEEIIRNYLKALRYDDADK